MRCRWFRAQGVAVTMTHRTNPIAPVKRRLQLSKARSGPERMSSRSQVEHTEREQPVQLLLCDFDNTIADFDAGDYPTQLHTDLVGSKP